jgi:hypothetical protein
MSHDKVVLFIETHMDSITADQREELLELHYAAVRNAHMRGYRKALKDNSELNKLIASQKAEEAKEEDLVRMEQTPIENVPPAPAPPPSKRIIREDDGVHIIAVVLGCISLTAGAAAIIFDNWPIF